MGWISEIKINKKYKAAFKNKNRYLVLYGGAGSGKSVFAAQKILIRLLLESGHRFLLVRKIANTIRKSQFQLFKDLVSVYGLNNKVRFIDSDLRIKFANGNKIVTAGLDDSEKLKSIQGITGIWVEEATEISKNDFKQLDLRLRGKTKNYKQIILSFNPISKFHWLIKDFVDSNYRNSFVLQTTYKDNRFLDDEYISVLENLINEDYNLYRIYVLGEPGVLENLIYPNVKFIGENQIPKKIDETIYGLDFGFNNPSALLKIMIADGVNLYLKGMLYKRGLINSELIKEIKTILPPAEWSQKPFYGDSAEPDRIQEFQDNGFFIYPAVKDVVPGIDFVKKFKIYVVNDDEDLKTEFNAYKWKEDKDGNIIDQPIKAFDHYMDALRYGVYSHYKINSLINEVESF